MASGYTAGLIGKEIAARCRVSHNTVIKQTQSIYDKAGCKRSTNALVAWFLSVNRDIDLREFERRIGAVILLCLLAIHAAYDQGDSKFARRTSSRRVEARKGGRRRHEDDTLNLFETL